MKVSDTLEDNKKHFKSAGGLASDSGPLVAFCCTLHLWVSMKLSNFAFPWVEFHKMGVLFYYIECTCTTVLISREDKWISKIWPDLVTLVWPNLCFIPCKLLYLTVVNVYCSSRGAMCQFWANNPWWCHTDVIRDSLVIIVRDWKDKCLRESLHYKLGT